MTGTLLPTFRPPVTVTAPFPLTLCDQPIVTAVCAALTTGNNGVVACAGLLAYQYGAWRHVLGCGPTCPDPEPEICQHPTCTDVADIDVVCLRDRSFCCGCCAELDDQLEGRRLWPIR